MQLIVWSNKHSLIIVNDHFHLQYVACSLYYNYNSHLQEEKPNKAHNTCVAVMVEESLLIIFCSSSLPVWLGEAVAPHHPPGLWPCVRLNHEEFGCMTVSAWSCCVLMFWAVHPALRFWFRQQSTMVKYDYIAFQFHSWQWCYHFLCSSIVYKTSSSRKKKMN